MHYQAPASPAFQQNDQWYPWHQLTCQHQHQRPYLSELDTVNGIPDQNLDAHWHQHHASYDYRSTWAVQTPLTASASSPTSLSRTTSWPTFPPPSTWTSPLTSPECGLPAFVSPTAVTTTPFLVGVSAPISTAQSPARRSSASFDSHMHPLNSPYYQHHTPIIYQQMRPSEAYESRPPFSDASSHTIFSHHQSQPEVSTDGLQLSGLGIEPVQDLTYPVYIKKDDQHESRSPPTTPIDTASAKRLTKRRKRKESPSSFRRYRPFHCPFCTFSFDRKCNLTCHLKTHGVGRGRVTCPEEGCGKQYGRQADVNRHMKSTHHGASFTCDDCGKIFGRNDILMRHEEACLKRKERLRCSEGEEDQEDLVEGYFCSDMWKKHTNIG